MQSRFSTTLPGALYWYYWLGCDEKRGEALREAVKSIPLNRLILKQCALSVSQNLRPRKRNNEPAFTPYR